MFYHLLDNPEVLQKAQQEVDEVVGNEPLEVKHLPKLKYIEACIRETLRFMGPINIFTQGGRQDEIIGGKYKVEKGTGIMVNLHGLLLDLKVWGEDHDKFRPERLLGGNWEKLPPNAWKAFGTGLRACIGRALVCPATCSDRMFVLKSIEPCFVSTSHTDRLLRLNKKCL